MSNCQTDIACFHQPHICDTNCEDICRAIYMKCMHCSLYYRVVSEFRVYRKNNKCNDWEEYKSAAQYAWYASFVCVYPSLEKDENMFDVAYSIHLHMSILDIFGVVCEKKITHIAKSTEFLWENSSLSRYSGRLCDEDFAICKRIGYSRCQYLRALTWGCFN